MATASERARQRRQRRSLGYIAPPTPAEARPGAIEQALTAIGRVPWAALDAIDYVGSTARAGLGQLTGIRGTGRDTILGPAPTGRQFLGIPQDARGLLPMAAGFTTELALDPLTYVGVGALTKGGKLAQRGDRLLDAYRAARAGGQRRKAAESLLELRNLRSPGRARRQLQMAPDWASQARAGQRSALSFQPLVLSNRINAPLVGAPLGGQGLGLLERVGNTLVRAAGPVARALRPGTIGVETTGDKSARDLFNASAESAKELGRAVRGLGEEAAQTTSTTLVKVAGDQNQVAAIRSGIEQQVAAAKGLINQRYLAEINAAPNLTEVGKIVERRNRALSAVELPLKRATAIQEISALTGHMVERGGTERLARITARMMEDAELIKQRYGSLAEKHANDPKKLAQVEARRDKQLNALANKYVRQQADAAIMDDVGQVMDNALADVSPELAAEVNRVRLLNGKLIDAEQAIGVPVSALGDPINAYLHRPLTPEGRAWLNQVEAESPFAALLNERNTAESFTKGRAGGIFRGKTIGQLNDMARLNGMQGDLFRENVVESMVRRAYQSASAQAAAAHITAVAKLFSTTDKGVPIEKLLHKANLSKFDGESLKRAVGRPGRVKIDKSVATVKAALKGTEFEGLKVPKELADETLKFYKTIQDPDDLTSLLRYVDQANSLFRGMVTQAFPDFHIRNEVGNVYMSWMAGMKNPAWFARAATIQRKLPELIRRRQAGKTLSPEDLDTLRLHDESIEYASVGRGFADEVDRLGKAVTPVGRSTQAATAAQRALGVPIAAYRAGRATGNALENNAKLALYMWARQSQKLSRVEAGELVRKYLFDYADLSRVEKQHIQRWMFFYTFMRKSMPLMAEQVLGNPRRLAATGHVIGEVGSQREERDVLPPWLRGRLPIKSPFDQEGDPSYFFPDLPVTELFRWTDEGRGVQRFGQKLLNTLAPIPKFIGEAAMGTSLSTGLPLRQSEGPLFQATQAIPEGPVRKALAPIANIEQFLPTSRITGTASRVAERGPISLINALAPREIDMQTQPIKNQLRAISQSLTQYEAQGLSDSLRAKRLRSLQARLRRQIGRINEVRGDES